MIRLPRNERKTPVAPEKNPSPEHPVEEWGYDTLLAAVERGGRTERHRIALALEADPRGALADQLEEVLEAAPPTRRTAAFRRVLFSALVCAGGPSARS